jgi:DNA-binding GntR family transcriptional regulator
MNESVIARESISDRVCQVIMQRILDGTYPPGFRLVELQLAREFNTSQAPVREAFCKMEASGLVETEPYRGTRVRQVSEREMSEASQVRGVLEQLAAELSAANLQRNLKPLRAEADAVSAAAKAGNPEAYVTRNHLFHRLIVEAAGNAALLRTWDSLAFAVGSHVRFVPGSVDLVATAREHQEIVGALARGDGRTAGKLLRRHAESPAPAPAGNHALVAKDRVPAATTRALTSAVSRRPHR